MKGRSHRLQPSEPPDDWGDGSWTVDCSCGVTFDDGEEMVSCDECGVWVHTRCARFARGEASFACHKCKASARRCAHQDTTEETEVAQLLAELPTKAADPWLPPLPRRPHIPMDQRVHVHGEPGGDPALFEGVSRVFSPQLWKCAGYIPKKFKFACREFWDGEEGGSENPASEGADVLFSLSKEIVPCLPARTLLESMPSQERVKKQEVDKVPCRSAIRSQGSSKKERNKIRLLGANLGKRRRDDLVEGKKRARGDFDRALADVKKKESDVLDVKGEARKEDITPEPKFTDEVEGTKTGSKPKHVLVIKASRGGLCDEASRQRSLVETAVKVEKMEHVVSQVEEIVAAKESVVNEDNSKLLHGLKEIKDENHFEGVLNGSSCAVVIENSRPAINDLSLEAEDIEIPTAPHTIGAIPLGSKLDKIEVKLDKGDDQDGKLHHDSTLPSDEHESQDAQTESNVSHQTLDDTTEGKASKFIEPKLHGHVIKSAGSSTLQKDTLEPRHGSKYLGPTKLGYSHSSLTTSHMRKLVVGFGKVSSALALAPSVSGINKAQGDAASTKVEKGEESIPELSRQTENDSNDSEFAKEQLISPPPKASTTDNTTSLASSNGTTGSLQSQKDSTQIKLIPSGPCQKNEKINQPIPQSSKAFNHPMAMHPPVSVKTTATLSDEELALLLHQELNSSPRVPRVPRVRQASGMQLAAPTTPSMLKRSSSSGGKDQVSRRKSKEDASRDGSRSSRDLTDETKRMGRVPSSPDQRQQESTSIADAPSKKDTWNRSPDAALSFEASGQKGFSLRSSPRDVPNDVGTLTRRTLPGLIDEILGKGRRMTYDELCEAVRPQWLNLRKPNGERYAYSSHSHAVLDCLRNRNEWAHLVDRGPKTNSSKRRRKSDSDVPAVESEGEEARNKAASRELEDKSVEAHREDVPRGKRNARKPRRLELRGKGVREMIRKSLNQDAALDNEPTTAFSHSSNDLAEGNFSDDESQGAACQPGSGDGASSSNDDTD